MSEAQHLLRSPRNAERLNRAIAQAEAGELREAEPAVCSSTTSVNIPRPGSANRSC